MFTQTTAFYDKVYAARGKDYVREATAIATLVRAAVPGARTLLDVGCGTGAHLAAFAALGFASRGVDADFKMVALARSRVPEVPIEPADMTVMALGERFDAIVSLFGTTAYARVPARLDATVARLAAHLESGGILVVEAFLSPADFRAGHVDGVFVDEPGLKIARMSVSKQLGTIGTLDFHYLVASLTSVERYFERHEVGLFSAATYQSAFGKAGLTFAPAAVPEIAFERPLYVGRHAGQATQT